jgi:hypothetical protein
VYRYTGLQIHRLYKISLFSERRQSCCKDKMRWTSLLLIGLGLATVGAQAPLNKSSRQSDAADEDCPADNVSFELITGGRVED